MTLQLLMDITQFLAQNCASIGGKLAYDNPNDKLYNRRRLSAGCEPLPNRCSAKFSFGGGFNCDEYPFARTYTVDPGNTRVNRCVPSVQNSSKLITNGNVQFHSNILVFATGQGGKFNAFLGNEISGVWPTSTTVHLLCWIY